MSSTSSREAMGCKQTWELSCLSFIQTIRCPSEQSQLGTIYTGWQKGRVSIRRNECGQRQGKHCGATSEHLWIRRIIIPRVSQSGLACHYIVQRGSGGSGRAVLLQSQSQWSSGDFSTRSQRCFPIQRKLKLCRSLSSFTLGRKVGICIVPIWQPLKKTTGTNWVRGEVN